MGYFVGRFFPVSPNAEHLVVRDFGLRGPIDPLFKVLKSLNYFRGSLGIGNTETAPHCEWQFNNDFSHGAKTPFQGWNCTTRVECILVGQLKQ